MRARLEPFAQSGLWEQLQAAAAGPGPRLCCNLIASVRLVQLRKGAVSHGLRSTMGVEVETIRPGDGKSYPKKGQKVNVHYTGTLTNGMKFDSSRDRCLPFSFRIGHGEVIRGWDDGVMRMSIGQRAKLICSSDFAYGSEGYPGVIPANATLIFDVELLSIG